MSQPELLKLVTEVLEALGIEYMAVGSIKISGGSEKQYTDALRVYEVQRVKLDVEYLERWAHELGVQCDWERLKAEAEVV